MKKILTSAVFLVSLLTYSQSVLMTINKDSIYTGQFEKEQKKSLELVGVKQTLDNYITFNLLKQFASDQGVTNSSFYQSRLVKEGEKLKDEKYYSPEKLEPLLQDFYQKIKTERKIQLLIFKNEVLPSNEKQREKFISSVIKEINNKTINFSQAVEKYSAVSKYKDPSYFDIFTLSRDFLDAIYQAPLNQVTEFKNASAVSLILVSNERKYLGEVMLDEIVINDTSDKGREKAEAVYKEINQGLSFAEAKKKYNQSTAERGGYIYTNLENENLYNLVAHMGKSSLFPPVKTEKGYSIYVYLFKESYDNYEVARPRLYSRLKKSEYAQVLDKDLIEELKKSSFYHSNTQELNKYYASLPKTYKEFQNYKITDTINLITIGDEYRLTNYDLSEQMKKISEKEYPDIKNLSNQAISVWEHEYLLEYYKIGFHQLDRFKDDWKDLQNRLLTEIAFSIITEQAINDVKGQKEFLEKEGSKFVWKKRIEGVFYYCLNSEVEKEVLKLLKEKKTPEYISNYFKGKTDENKRELLTVNEGKYSPETLNLPLHEKLSKKIYTVDYNNGRMVVDIKNIIENDKMSLEELQSTHINEYIDYKMGKVIEGLRKEAVINIDRSQEELLQKKYSL